MNWGGGNRKGLEAVISQENEHCRVWAPRHLAVKPLISLEVGLWGRSLSWIKLLGLKVGVGHFLCFLSVPDKCELRLVGMGFEWLWSGTPGKAVVGQHLAGLALVWSRATTHPKVL